MPNPRWGECPVRRLSQAGEGSLCWPNKLGLTFPPSAQVRSGHQAQRETANPSQTTWRGVWGGDAGSELAKQPPRPSTTSSSLGSLPPPGDFLLGTLTPASPGSPGSLHSCPPISPGSAWMLLESVQCVSDREPCPSAKTKQTPYCSRLTQSLALTALRNIKLVLKEV